MLSDEMTHDNFDFVEDLSQPMYFFLAKAQASDGANNGLVTAGLENISKNPVTTEQNQIPSLRSNNQQMNVMALDLDENLYLIPPEYQHQVEMAIEDQQIMDAQGFELSPDTKDKR